MTLPSWLLLLAAAPQYSFAWTPTPEERHAQGENWALVRDTAVTWACIVVGLLLYNGLHKLLDSVRRVVNLNQNDVGTTNQLYFAIPNESLAKLKKHWLLAPLFRKRQMREFKLSAAVNMGILPSRIQAFWLLVYFTMNIATALVRIHWWLGRTVWLNDLCNRTGTLATVNLIPLFLFAGRNNPLIRLFDISFDNFNLLHRWMGRVVIVEAVLHGALWMAGQVIEAGWSSVAPAMAATNDPLVLTGTIGASAFVVILLQSPSFVRHAFYETFLHIHILLASLSVVVVWLHLDGFGQQSLLLGAIIIWAVERAIRFYSLIHSNFHRGVTKAEVEALPGDAMRVTLRVARPWKFKPGQHIYLYVPSIGWWTSHPFTIAWSQEDDRWRSEKSLPTTRQDVLARKSTSLSLIVRRRTGFTDKMWCKAEQAWGNKFIATALIEGPYGCRDFKSYGTVVLFAAGVGITHQVPQVRDLIRGYANGTAATRKVLLVWILQCPEHLEWIRPWMTEILQMGKRRDILRIMLFVTRPRSTKEIQSPSASVQMFPGKPNVAALIEKEQETQIGAMAVSCCGTGSLSDDCRKAVRERCLDSEIDFSEENFSWRGALSLQRVRSCMMYGL